jgi:hypothetical protein
MLHYLILKVFVRYSKNVNNELLKIIKYYQNYNLILFTRFTYLINNFLKKQKKINITNPKNYPYSDL